MCATGICYACRQRAEQLWTSLASGGDTTDTAATEDRSGLPTITVDDRGPRTVRYSRSFMETNPLTRDIPVSTLPLSSSFAARLMGTTTPSTSTHAVSTTSPTVAPTPEVAVVADPQTRALDQLERQVEAVFASRENRLEETAFVPHERQDFDAFLGRVREILRDGEAETIQGAIDVVRDEHLTAVRHRREVAETRRPTMTRTYAEMTEPHLPSYPAFFDDAGERRGDPMVWGLIDHARVEAGEVRLGEDVLSGGRLRHALDLAETLADRDGSYVVAGTLLQEVFAEQFQETEHWVDSERRDDVLELMRMTETDEEFNAGLLQMMSERMNDLVESGELSNSDPLAARAWALYNDIFDPGGDPVSFGGYVGWVGDPLNLSEETFQQMVDQLVILGITLPATMGAGALVEGAVAGTVAVRAAQTAAGIRTALLLSRFGPGVAEIGGEMAASGTRLVLAGTPALAAESTAQAYQEEGLTRRPVSIADTAASFGPFRFGGAAFRGSMGLAGRTAVGRGVTAWGERSAGHALVLGAGQVTAEQGFMTGLAMSMHDDISLESFGREGSTMVLSSAYLYILHAPFASRRPATSAMSTTTPDFEVSLADAAESVAPEPSGPGFWGRTGDFARDLFLAPAGFFLGMGMGAPIRFGRGRVIPASYRTTFEAGGGVIRVRMGEQTSYLLREADGTQRTVGRDAYNAYRNWLTGRYESLSESHAAVATGERGLRGLMEDFTGDGYERTPVADLILRSDSLRPTSRVRAGGRDFYLSPIIRTTSSDGPRTYCLGVTPVIEGGRVRLREVLFYRSNSDGNWRSAPYRMGEHLAKGRFRGPGDRGPSHYTQETQVAPEIAEHLEGLETHDPIEMSEQALGLIVNVEAEINRGRGESMLGRFGRQARFSLTPGLRPVQEYRPGRMSLWSEEGSAYGMSVDDLRSLTYPEGFIPDFSQGPLREYTREHTLLGETTYREYEGQLNGEPVIWTFAEASEDQVWIQGIRYQDALVTDFGTYDRVIDSGVLTSKPLEYTSQLGNLPEAYRRPVERTDGGPSLYEDVTPLLAELEPVRLYCEARDSGGDAGAEAVVAQPIISVGDVAEPVRDTLRDTPRDTPVVTPASSRAFPRAATAVRTAVAHANSFLSEATGFRFAIEAEVISSGTDEGGMPEVEVRVPGPEAETAFISALQAVSESVAVENLGDGNYIVHDPTRGDSRLSVRPGQELSLPQQRQLGEWFTPRLGAPREIRAYDPQTTLGDFVNFLADRGWDQPSLESYVSHFGGEEMIPRVAEILRSRDAESAERSVRAAE